MAKRVNKSATETKQTAAARRTKKTKTPVKKTPIKKKTVTVTNGKVKPAKTTKTTKKTAPPKGNVVSNGKKRLTTKTTLAEVAKKGAQAAVKPATKARGPKKNIIRLKESAPTAKFTEMGDKIKSGEFKWVYYATDGNIGYHHYEKLK